MSKQAREYGVISTDATGTRVERYPDADRGLCKSCRFWNQDDFPAGRGECVIAGTGAALVGDPESQMAVAVQNPDDMNEGEAWLITTADFGCVQWHGR